MKSQHTYIDFENVYDFQQFIIKIFKNITNLIKKFY